MRRKPLFPPPANLKGPGYRLRRKGRRSREVLTVNGAIRPQRQRYVVRHTGDPHAGAHPGVELAALPMVGDDPACQSKVTRGVREMMCRANLDAGSFANAASLLEEMAQISSSTERLRQVVEHEGRQVQRLQQTRPLAPAWTAEDCRVDAVDANQLLLPFCPTRVYTGCDGVMVPRVTEAEKHKRREAVKARRRRRRRKQPDAKRPKSLPSRRQGADHPWKELKLVHHYDQHAERSHVSTTSADHRVAGAVIARDARKLKTAKADEHVALVDGAPWIRARLADAGLDLDAVGLDFYHLAEHVHEARRRVFGEDDPDGHAWARDLLRQVRDEGYDAFRDRIIQTRQSRRGGKRKALGRLLDYAAARADMIDYPRFQAHGWHIGSGPTEAACKHIPRRLKGSGMRWDQPGVDAITHLAALHHSGQWQSYWSQAA
ncbi:MAG: hypothetical protein ACLFV7_14125 [Phycisphaerae bacterium]